MSYARVKSAKPTQTRGRGSTPHFNIRRTASEGQRVPSRASALERIEAEYEVKLAVHKEKELEREAKKREQYLKKYQHVDQGHRLSEGYLDEAAGFSNTPSFQEAQEEVRRRQQNELMRKALEHQELQRQLKEKAQKREQEKVAEKMDRYKHINAGYKLGSKPRESRAIEIPSPVASVMSATPKNNDSLPKNDVKIDVDIAADLLMDGESLEEALELQEQLLLQAAKIKEQISRKWPEISTALPPREIKIDADSQSTNPKQISNNSRTKTQGNSGVMNAMKVKAAPSNKICEKAVTPQLKLEQTIQSKKEVKEHAMKLPIEALKLQSSHSLSEVAATSQQSTVVHSKKFEAEAALNLKPASHVLKTSSQGPVLVLRKTEEDLNRALSRRLEVQDEIDKNGYSPLYKATIEKAEYFNNGFDRDIGKLTGAIPKQKSLGLSKREIEHPKPVEEPVDHQAEMRAARQKMQQKYEEALRKQQNQE